MAKLTESMTSVRGPAEPGDMLCYTGRGKEGEKEVQVTRTSRPYVYDLADAYNARNASDQGEWFVDNSGNLRFGDSLEFGVENTRRIAQSKETERARWMRGYLNAQPRDEAA